MQSTGFGQSFGTADQCRDDGQRREHERSRLGRLLHRVDSDAGVVADALVTLDREAGNLHDLVVVDFGAQAFVSAGLVMCQPIEVFQRVWLLTVWLTAASQGLSGFSTTNSARPIDSTPPARTMPAASRRTAEREPP